MSITIYSIHLKFPLPSSFMALAGIGDASAIIAVADLGLKLAQTLVTIIGDFRDAAININRLRDEIHLTAICLQQLGDLAKQNRLIAGRGVLEATNLRERTRAVIWEIRTVIKKGDDPLQPDDVDQTEIDVTYFTAWKWALWTKKHLEGPRLELDRLKDSMTLTFVSHMAILASDDRERRLYQSQIPGIRRNCAWSEEQYRNDEQPTAPPIPQELLDAGPEEWQRFIEWRQKNLQDVNIDVEALKNRLLAAGVASDLLATVLDDSTGGLPIPPKREIEYQAWTLEPLVGRVQIGLNNAPRSSPDEVQAVHSKLKPWYKKQIDELIEEQDPSLEWSVLSLKVIHKSILRRVENPPALHIILKGDPRPLTIQPIQKRMNTEQVIEIQPISDQQSQALAYMDSVPFDEPVDTKKTDDQLIQEQLALYGREETASSSDL